MKVISTPAEFIQLIQPGDEFWSTPIGSRTLRGPYTAIFVGQERLSFLSVQSRKCNDHSVILSDFLTKNTAYKEAEKSYTPDLSFAGIFAK